MKFLTTQSSPAFCHFLLVRNILLTILSQTSSIYDLPLVWETKVYTHTHTHIKQSEQFVSHAYEL